jgi:hypothetical protein
MTPLRYMGEGEFRTVNAYHARALDKALVVGEILTWEQIEERSQKSHAHFFVAVHEAWLNLPETISMEFPNSESLRKYALIKAGFCTVKKVACRTNREANELTAYLLGLDNFLVCEVSDNVATIYRAESQSMKAMGKKRFQESKQAVLDVLSAMIGAEVTELAA